jgi:two-component system, NtrC family, sensor histidine kinase HydH
MALQIPDRTQELFDEQLDANYARTSRMFAVLMSAEWLAGIVVALLWSPYTWAGKIHAVHLHVYIATLLGGATLSLPIVLALLRPAWPITRYVVAVGQMLWSALLIHLTGGRIETHFQIFGSLAFLAFYRDWKVLVPATAVVAADHLLRQLFWPESVYGILNPEWWRFIEHAFWVVFEDVVLVLSCLRGTQEAWDLAARHAEVESLSQTEKRKADKLSKALLDLEQSQETLTRVEKLAAVGQLAASVGHELRNPLAAVRNAHTYIAKRIARDESPLASDPRIKQFSEIVERELNACSKIISDLLDFARARPPNLRPCPLGPLVDESITLVLTKTAVTIINEIPADMPVPNIDKDQFRQIVINLIQNAVEAMPPDHVGVVTVRAEGGAGNRPWKISISDNGPGIPQELVSKIFQPLFTTKVKGTGLGLAVVSSVIEAHKGKVAVHSRPGEGADFVIELPCSSAA